MGAARLAWLCVGGNLESVCRMPAVSHRFEPDAAEAHLLADRYARFRELYPALRTHFRMSA